MLRLLVLSGLVAFAFAQSQCRDSDAPNWNHSYDCCNGGGCGEGEGDCDNQGHCGGNLVCGKDNCQYMNPGDGYPGDSDCCYRPCRGEPGWDFSYDCCGEGGDCNEGEGDCDGHGQCEGNLRCGRDNCRYMNPGEGFPGDADCCYQPCRGEPGWNFSYDCCGEGGDCGEGEGDCDGHNQCEGNLRCGRDNCRAMNPGEGEFPNDADCCYQPCRGEPGWSFSYRCCTDGGDCGHGEGDCDNDNECEGNLVCGNNNCQAMNPGEGYPADADCCTSA